MYVLELKSSFYLTSNFNNLSVKFPTFRFPIFFSSNLLVFKKKYAMISNSHKMGYNFTQCCSPVRDMKAVQKYPEQHF